MTLPLAGVHIAVTRPPAQATRLNAAITEAGGSVISFPLLEISGLPDLDAFHAAVTPLAQFQWVIFISSNAVQYGMPLLQQATIPPALKFAAIGPTTASALQAYGVADVLTPEDRFDSESLLSLPAFQHMQGQRVLIVRGVGGRELMAETLTQRGAEVVFGECYRRINPQTTIASLAHEHAQNRLQGIVITSTEALRFLLDLAGNTPWLRTVPLFVNHDRIAEQAAVHGLMAFSAGQAGDGAMVQLITDYFQTRV
ncbi:uroporphyrinogen-III synthase [Methylophilus rhizosphaerae]|uniref:Uroporphyrinogen-III synthase n=1 Tax=Methylophilus rhizosphaerae TaxID=492660 RepID=A0A1G9EC53_9PROT|nr:uroporphyrinogen-III synthase [Methylophilus rhizosphaerae]SDK73668.1 uroporphyrinogen-III synthase [Methylophilus rhizosphaerae]